MPDALTDVAAEVSWLGPSVTEDELAHFEITYREGRTDYVKANFGAEASLSPADLPADLSGFDCVHLVPLGNIRNQREFMRACKSNGARRISAGTALDLINEQPDDAAAILEQADFFFLNEEEAIRLFGSISAVRSRPGQALFVTQGSDGATVVLGDVATQLPAIATVVHDPTGAGDTFCGATLAGIATGQHPVMAARQAIPLAARMIRKVGPAALMQSAPPQQPHPDERVCVDAERVNQVAKLIAGLGDIRPFAFIGPDLPPPDHPATLDYFFASTLQQFSFWTASEGRYDRPLIATIDGEQRKGAFYLFRAYLRWLENNPELLTPAGQAELTMADLQTVLRADDGSDPMPAMDLHLQLARQYGRDMLALELTPQTMLRTVNSSSDPVQTLLRVLDHVGGYKEDPLRKKSALLAAVLQQRPEAFIHNRDDPVPPIIDYHVMRSCLRIGMIDVRDEELVAKLIGRELLSESEEAALRHAVYAAVEQLVPASGKSMGAVDWFFFQARRRCPEMSEPLCNECAVAPVCDKRKTLFQPVRRTSFY